MLPIAQPQLTREFLEDCYPIDQGYSWPSTMPGVLYVWDIVEKDDVDYIIEGYFGVRQRDTIPEYIIDELIISLPSHFSIREYNLTAQDNLLNIELGIDELV
mgnify:FL=1